MMRESDPMLARLKSLAIEPRIAKIESATELKSKGMKSKDEVAGTPTFVEPQIQQEKNTYTSHLHPQEDIYFHSTLKAMVRPSIKRLALLSELTHFELRQKNKIRIIKKVAENHGLESHSDGSTLTTVAYYYNKQNKINLVCSTVGDSPAFLILKQDGKYQVRRINKDHDLTDKNSDYMSLFEAGLVYRHQGLRVNGINMTRSFGDETITEEGHRDEDYESLTPAVPDYTAYSITPTDYEEMHVLVASDGIYTNKVNTLKVMADYLNGATGDIKTLARHLVSNVKRRSNRSRQVKREHDDITIVLSSLAASPEKTSLIGVADGHGGGGTSKFLKKEFSKTFAKHQKSYSEISEDLLELQLKVIQKAKEIAMNPNWRKQVFIKSKDFVVGALKFFDIRIDCFKSFAAPKGVAHIGNETISSIKQLKNIGEARNSAKHQYLFRHSEVRSNATKQFYHLLANMKETDLASLGATYKALGSFEATYLEVKRERSINFTPKAT